MSRRGSPREREYRNSGRRDRGITRGDWSAEEWRGRGNKRHDRRRRSRSPRQRSTSQSRSPRRKERRRSNRTPSPRRRRSNNRYSSRSPSNRRNRSRRVSPKRSRSPKWRRSEREVSSRRTRHRRRSGSSTSRSPVRRSRRRGHNTRSARRRDYSSSGNSSGSESEMYRRRRRKKLDKMKRRNVVYRIGDKVEIKTQGSRSRRARWFPAEVYEVWRDGMYGELTYSVSVKGSRRIEDYVRSDELRFREPRDLDKRIREDEVVREDEFARCREDMRHYNLELTRHNPQGRGPSTRGRRPIRQGAARAWPQERARSVDGNAHISARAERQQPRALSVPPADYTWPELLAEFAKLTCGVGGDQGFPPEENDGNGFTDRIPDHGDHKTGDYTRVTRHYDDAPIEEKELDERDHRAVVNDVNRGGSNVADYIELTYPRNQDSYMSDPRGTNPRNLKDRMNRNAITVTCDYRD